MSRSPLSPPVEVNPEVDEIHDRVRGHDQSHAVVPEMSGGEEDFFFFFKKRKKKEKRRRYILRDLSVCCSAFPRGLR